MKHLNYVLLRLAVGIALAAMGGGLAWADGAVGLAADTEKPATVPPAPAGEKAVGKASARPEESPSNPQQAKESAEKPKAAPETPDPAKPDKPKQAEHSADKPKPSPEGNQRDSGGKGEPEQPKSPMPEPISKVIPHKPEPAAPPKPKLPPLPPWAPPGAEQVRDKVFAWLANRSVPPEVRAKVEGLWNGDLGQCRGLDMLLRVVVSYALADPQAAELLQLCGAPRMHLILPSFPWLKDPKTDPYMAANLRLLYGRWLVHEMLYDEALEMLADLKTDDVADPATLLFYRSVACYFLLHQEEGLQSLEALLREPSYCPRRYVALASLMQEDLKNLREETLDHIARRMRDVERRLGLHRAGPKVRHIEDKIVEDLDKIIKRLEEQQQQGGGSGSAGGRTIRSSSPAPDSRIIGGKGPGEVEKREIGSGSGWGNLPPKQREEVLQQIGRDFPAQYRDKIEQYFRKLASESADTKKSP